MPELALHDKGQGRMNPLSLRTINIVCAMLGILEIGTMVVLSFAVREGVHAVARCQSDPQNFRRNERLSESSAPLVTRLEESSDSDVCA